MLQSWYGQVNCSNIQYATVQGHKTTLSLGLIHITFLLVNWTSCHDLYACCCLSAQEKGIKCLCLWMEVSLSSCRESQTKRRVHTTPSIASMSSNWQKKIWNRETGCLFLGNWNSGQRNIQLSLHSLVSMLQINPNRNMHFKHCQLGDDLEFGWIPPEAAAPRLIFHIPS